MTTSRHIFALLKSHYEGDSDLFYSVGIQFAATEARKGHTQVAQELRKLLDEGRSKENNIKTTTFPTLHLREDLKGLIHVQAPTISLRDMILKPALRDSLERVLIEYRQRKTLQEYNLQPRRKILLVGPPGAGKTMTAAAIAGELHLSLNTVILEALFTKFLGETASKLKSIFESMRANKAVYFFDEFDAVGTRRSSVNDVGEVRRVLNSFLQLMEDDLGDSIIIAATNHPELLDKALFRRFDDVIYYNMPDEEVMNSIFKVRLQSFDIHQVEWRSISSEAEGLSQAEIVKAADNAAKRSLLNHSKSISTSMLLDAIRERHIANKFKE